MLRRLINLFRFTRSEQRSIVLLLFILIFINLLGQIKGGADKTPVELLPADNSSGYEKESISINGIEDPKDYFNIDEIDEAKAYYSGGKKAGREEIRKQNNKIELNSADSSKLLNLYGIGPVFASRIVKYRNLLGGYHSKEQLLEVYGMDSARYLGFEERIYIDSTSIHRINVNTSSFREFLRHPYLDYEAVKKLVRYRDRHGSLESPELLWRDSVISPDIKKKLLPYLKN